MTCTDANKCPVVCYEFALRQVHMSVVLKLYDDTKGVREVRLGDVLPTGI